MKYAVSGFCGMIGYALARTLQKEDTIVALVRPNAEIPESIKKIENIKIEECDIRNYTNYNTEECADVFIHLAWLSTSGEGRENLRLQLENISYTLDAVELAARMKCKVFIGAGSQAEYGITNELLTPNTPVDPLSCYGIAKYCAGRMSAKLCEKYGMRINWVRFLSVYGEYDNEQSLISYLIKSFLNSEVPKVTDCRQIWDYIYCDDAARALYKTAECGADKKSYTIGSGKGLPLKDYVMKIRDIVSKNADIDFGACEYGAFQPVYLCADISELEKDTGFKPCIDFDTGIQRCVDFVKERQ